MSDYGRAAFEAAMRKLNDGALPARENWEALLPLQQEAWESAADAVLTEYDPEYQSNKVGW